MRVGYILYNVLTTHMQEFFLIKNKNMKINQIIRSCGGIATVAYHLEITSHAVEKWIERKRIPSRYFPVLIELSEGELSFEKLYEANEWDGEC